MESQPQETSKEPARKNQRGRRGWLHSLRRIATALLAFYLVVVVMLMIFENRLIFPALKYREGDPGWDLAGTGFEDVWFECDGNRLNGWYAAHPQPKAVVLFCHGNGGNVTHRRQVLHDLRDLCDASVFVFDYRGYGRSEGSPDEAGVLADARAARTWLAERENIPEDKIVMMGRSLGGAVAVDLAAKDGARGLVLESTFSSVPDVASDIYPFLPVRLLIRTQFDSGSKIKDYKGPLLQSHGDADSIIPFRFGKKLFEAANEPKQFIALENFDHNEWQPDEYYRALAEFFDQLPD